MPCLGHFLGGIRAPIQKMIPDFERTTGHKVKATFGSGNGTKKQVMSGEAFDVPIVQPPLAEVIATGNVIPFPVPNGKGRDREAIAAFLDRLPDDELYYLGSEIRDRSELGVTEKNGSPPAPTSASPST